MVRGTSRPPSPGQFLTTNLSNLSIYIFLLLLLFLFRAAPVAYGVSQARGQIGAVAAGLYHSHSNVRSKLRLRPIPQLTAMPDP